MAITKIEVERVSVISSKPFETVVGAFRAAVGRPDMAEFAKENDWRPDVRRIGKRGSGVWAGPAS